MAWLTTVSPAGKPDTVPVWYLLRDDETILIYSRPGKAKLRNIDHDPAVALGLDVTDLGRDVIRLEGAATRRPDTPPADQVPEYVAKYVERIAAIFGTAERFAELFSEAVVVTRSAPLVEGRPRPRLSTVLVAIVPPRRAFS